MSASRQLDARAGAGLARPAAHRRSASSPWRRRSPRSSSRVGAGDRVVGVSTYCDYPPEVARIDRIGTFLQPNVERILAKRPDLIIGVPSPGNRASVQRLQELGLRVLIVESGAHRRHPHGDPHHRRRGRQRTAGRGRRGAHRARHRRRDGAPGGRAATARPDAGRPLAVRRRRPRDVSGRADRPCAVATTSRRRSGRRGRRVNLEWIVAQAPEVIIDASMGSEDAPTATARWRSGASSPPSRPCATSASTATAPRAAAPRTAGRRNAGDVARFIHPERF